MTFTDPNGEDPFTAAIIIGAIIGAASYTANVAFSEQGFDNWNWGQFVGSVGVGAVSGAFTYGIGDAFAGVSPSLPQESFLVACRKIKHSKVQKF